MESCNRDKERVFAKEEEGVSIVKGRERRGIWVYWRTIEEEIYQALKIPSNGASIFCRKEEW